MLSFRFLFLSLFIWTNHCETITCAKQQSCECVQNNACIINCIGEDYCKPSSVTLTCKHAQPCTIKCIGIATCGDAYVDGSRATDVTVTCNGKDACKGSGSIVCGSGDCAIKCIKKGDGNTCNKRIYTNNARSFQCTGTDCPIDWPNSYSLAPTPPPTPEPTTRPTFPPTNRPTRQPTPFPTTKPTPLPTTAPTAPPTNKPTLLPTNGPIQPPTMTPTRAPSTTQTPTFSPTKHPTLYPTERQPTLPTHITNTPSSSPITVPTSHPSNQPTTHPTIHPSYNPSERPTIHPSPPNPPVHTTRSPFRHPPLYHPTTYMPSPQPSNAPSIQPTNMPSAYPTDAPIVHPTNMPIIHPTNRPTMSPTERPSFHPSIDPSSRKILRSPSKYPSKYPTYLTTPWQLAVSIIDDTDDDRSDQAGSSNKRVSFLHNERNWILASLGMGACVCLIGIVARQQRIVKQLKDIQIGLDNAHGISKIVSQSDREAEDCIHMEGDYDERASNKTSIDDTFTKLNDLNISIIRKHSNFGKMNAVHRVSDISEESISESTDSDIYNDDNALITTTYGMDVDRVTAYVDEIVHCEDDEEESSDDSIMVQRDRNDEKEVIDGVYVNQLIDNYASLRESRSIYRRIT